MSRLADLEEEVAASRERLNATIDQIQDRLTLSGMVNEVMGQAGVAGFEDGRSVVQDLLRRYPLPIMLAAAGVGYLIYRSKRRPRPDMVEGTLASPVSRVGHGRRYDPDAPVGRPRLEPVDGRDPAQA